MFGGFYISANRLAAWPTAGRTKMIAISGHSVPDWTREVEVRATGTPLRTSESEA
jgi:hypothetical protein